MKKIHYLNKNDKYGFLVIRNIFKKDRRLYCTCKCERCGNENFEVRADSLTSGRTTSCGCLNRELNNYKPKNITGKKFNRLKAIKDTGKIKGTSHLWEFECDCGNIIERELGLVTSGKIKSCGCYATEKSSEQGKENIKKIQDQYIRDHTNLKLISKTDANADSELGIRHIHYDKNRRKYSVQMTYKGKHYNLGRYDSLEDALKVRDLAYDARLKDSIDSFHENLKKGDINV